MTHKTKTWLANEQVNTIRWLAQIPDLKLIEHLWNGLKLCQEAFLRLPSNKKELLGRAVREWSKIIPETSSKIFNLMPCRIEAFLAVKGGRTKL
jgi:hypothetical protein